MCRNYKKFLLLREPSYVASFHCELSLPKPGYEWPNSGTFRCFSSLWAIMNNIGRCRVSYGHIFFVLFGYFLTMVCTYAL